MNRDTFIRLTQTSLSRMGVYKGEIDGSWGPRSQAAFDSVIHGKPEASPEVHSVMASSFADPADIKAFEKCKATGKSDNECFKVGDNGIGWMGDDCTTGVPMCALPFEDWIEKWGNKFNARLKPVEVTANGVTIICLLGDTMPHRGNIHNGCGIDLSPAAVEKLGLHPPVRFRATWKWV